MKPASVIESSGSAEVVVGAYISSARDFCLLPTNLGASGKSKRRAHFLLPRCLLRVLVFDRTGEVFSGCGDVGVKSSMLKLDHSTSRGNGLDGEGVSGDAISKRSRPLRRDSTLSNELLERREGRE